jgi:hypothetical protein
MHLLVLLLIYITKMLGTITKISNIKFNEESDTDKLKERS